MTNCAATHDKDAILIIYTGGTIGMQQSSQGYTPNAGIEALITQSFNQKNLDAIQPFDIIEFEQLIDSSNAQPSDWLKIANCINDNYDKYTGFIVLHGTDTMAYTACALHHIFGKNIKPIIVTGSQIPMCEIRSDGPSNLLDAIIYIRNSELAEVCISFAGDLLPAVSAKKVHTSALSAFKSVNKPALASADITLRVEAHQINSDTKKQFKLDTLSDNSVSVLLLYPGISKQAIDAVLLNEQTKAVIMLSFGAGNPPDANQDLISALKIARQRKTVILNMTQCHQGKVAQGCYAAGSILNELGVISAEDRTLEDALTDLYINLDRYLDNSLDT